MEFLRLLAVLADYVRLLRHARGEIDYWERRATDPLAHEKMHRERRNVESATFFSMLAAPRERLAAMRRVVRFQLAYELLDGLSEEASTVAESLRLHDALGVAAGAWIMTAKYDSYLDELVRTCGAITEPSEPMLEAVLRVGDAQAHNHAGRARAWAVGRRSELLWWEEAAAGISSLDLLAMLATPSDQHGAILDAYPEVCALSALLDALVDLPDDERTGNHNWLMHYESLRHASKRLTELAEIANDRLGRLEHARIHRAALAGLLAHNLVRAPEPFRRRLASAVPYTRSAIALFGARRLLSD
jgi:hypothetical protein